MIRTPRTLLAAAALLAVVGIAGCGDTQPPADAASATTTTAAGSTSKGQASDCSATPGTTVKVKIGAFMFQPATIKVAACDKVAWSNTHTQAHTSTGTGQQRWSTGNIQPGTTSDPIVFDTPGTFTYICALHPFMMGTVEVA